MKKPKTYYDAKQAMWETWFIASFIVFSAFLFAGMLDDSRTMFPNWLYFMIPVTINLIACLIYGMVKDTNNS